MRARRRLSVPKDATRIYFVDPVVPPKTRKAFRVLAGFLAAFLLLFGLPMAIHDVVTRPHDWLWNLFSLICCVYGGLGLAVGARTGRWYQVRA